LACYKLKSKDDLILLVGFIIYFTIPDILRKNAIVTGAASGLGYEFSKLLAEDSYHLILIDIDGSRLQKAKMELEQKYKVEVDLLVCDLSEARCVMEIYSKVNHLNIDVLINNAGFGLYGLFNLTEWQKEEKMIHLHILTLTHLTKLILIDMIARGSGRIMNVSSMAAFQPGPFMSVYYASKAYILSFTEALSNEVKGTGVTATVLCPGQTKTNFQKTVASYSDTKLPTNQNLTDSTWVANYGYKAMKSGKSVAIPGMLNKFLVQLHRIMPRGISLSLIRSVQEKMRK
jgi:uncharacterized protein